MSRILISARSGSIVLMLSVLTLGTQFIGSASAFAGAYLTLNSFSGNPGATLQVTGGGWNVGDTVNIFVGDTSGSPVGTAVAGSDSNISASIVLPANEPQGSLKIIGVDTTSSYQADNSYYVVPFTPSSKGTAPSHAPYAKVTVTGTGYAPNETVTLGLAGATGSATADSTGAFTGTVTVPMVASGLYNLTATGNSSNASSFDYFWIDTFYPSASPSTYYLMPGATLSFTGSGYAPGETINVTEKGSASSTPVSTFTADGAGSFTTAGGFAIPGADHGKSVTFTLTGTKSGISSSATVTIGDFYAYASPTSYYLLPGQLDSFSGGGFMAGETIDVFVEGSTTPATSFAAGQDGTFDSAGSVRVPFNAGPTVTFTLTGRTSHATGSASTGVGRYWSSLSPASYYVIPNADLIVTGASFAPNEAVILTVNGNTASSTIATTTEKGGFSSPVRIPFGTASATVKATGTMSGSSADVSVALAKFYPNINPSSWFVYPGGKVSYTGTGFVPGEDVTYTVGGAATSTVTADSFGTIRTASTTVPFSSTGSLSARFMGALSGAISNIKIAVGSLSPYLSADTYSASQGATAGVQGFSFGANEPVMVTAGSFSTTTMSDDNGTTPFVYITLPYKVSSLPVTFTGVNTGATASMKVSLQSYYAFLTSSSYYAKPGTTVTLTGNGFAPNENVDFGTGVSTTTARANAKGVASTDVVLPFTTDASIALTAEGETSGSQSALAIAFAPYIPQVAPSTYYTLPGTTVTFVGTGYAPNENVAVGFNGAAVGTIAADAKGAFSYDYAIPFGSTKATVSFIGATSGAGVADTISLANYAAYIGLSNYYGIGGTPVTVTGNGFAANESVTLSFNGVAFQTTQADKTGSIKVATAIPYSAPGTMPLWAVGAKTGVRAGSSYTVAPVYPGFTLGQYASAPGTSVTLNGSNFFPDETISVTTDRTGDAAVTTFTTDASGKFSGSYALPATFDEGTLVFTVLGNHSLTPESITFYVTGK